MIAGDVERLREVADPWRRVPWPNAVGIAPEEVADAISSGGLVSGPVDPEASRSVHVGRIAHLVVHGWDDPIQLDFGCPSFPGWRWSWPVTDGNHRLAAAIYRGDATIDLEWGGEVAVARRIFGDVVDREMEELKRRAEAPAP